ncbi:MAG: protease complex subunit PrcB family protein [Desulfurivibrio sp.]
MKTLMAVAAAAGGILLAACSTTPGGALPTEVLFTGQQCKTSTPDPSVTLIEQQAQLDRFYARLESLGMAPLRAPQLDFVHQRAVLIEMGVRSTGGYGLALAAEPAFLRDGKLELHVDWREPSPGLILTQALTSPCLLLKVPAGNYRQVTVLDRQGQVRAGE